MEKTTKVIVGLLVFIIVILGAFCVIITSNNKKDAALTSQIQEQLDAANSDLASTKSELNKATSQINKVKEAVNGIATEEKETKSTVAKTNKKLAISTENCLNPRKDDEYFKVDYGIYSFGLPESNSFNTYYRCDFKDGDAYVTKVVDGKESEKHKLENIDKKIVFAGKYFYTNVDSSYMFVLEDGTVNYIDLGRSIIEKGDYKTTKIDGVSNVVSILQGTDGHNGVALLIREDGKFYDSLQAISKMKGE